MVDFEVQEIDKDYDGEQFPPVGNVAEEIPPLALPGATMSAGRYPAALVEKCRALGSDVFTSVENIAKEHNVGRHVVYKLSKLVYSNQTNNPYNDFLSWFSRMRNMDPKYEPFGGREFNAVVYHPPHLTTTSGGSSGNPAEIWWKSGGNPPDIHWILINSIQNN